MQNYNVTVKILLCFSPLFIPKFRFDIIIRKNGKRYRIYYIINLNKTC